ncbi:MAG: DUF4191 domain-containing protein [Jatrophihabitans sp.]
MAAGAPKKPEKPTREAKKTARAESRGKRRQQFSQMREVFKVTRKADKRFLPYLILAFLVPAVVIWGLGGLLTGHWFLPIPIAVALGLIGAMFIFTRRAQAAMYSQADGQPGAALYVLQNLRGEWTTKEAVAATTQFDAVHRLTGRPGIVLVGEGASHRVKGLLAQEKRRVSRLVGDTPIYDIIVGGDEGQIPLKKLNAHLVRLPRNLSREQVTALNKRLGALTSARAPLPQGPMPAGAKMRNPARAVRRRS